jgi:hypothetical protein
MAQFKKGNTAAKGHKNKGERLATNILKRTKSGQELVKFYMDVFQGKIQGNAGNSGPPSLKYRLEAAHWLTERGFGRTPQTEEQEKGGITVQIVQYADGRPDEMRIVDGPRKDNTDTPQLPAKDVPKVVIDGSGSGVQTNDERVAPEGGEGLDVPESDDKGNVQESGSVLVSGSDIRTRQKNNLGWH